MKNSEQDKIFNWKLKNKLSNKVESVMLECYRRVHQFKNGDFKNAKMVELNHPSEVKEAKALGLVVPSSTETPRVLNWYDLTEKGVALLKDLDLPWGGKRMNDSLFS